MIFLVISWVLLLIAATIGVFHLWNHHTFKKKLTSHNAVSSTLSEREMLIIYDLEIEREKGFSQKESDPSKLALKH